jgi:hypothetical protein
MAAEKSSTSFHSGHYLGRIGPGARQIETTRHPDGARFTFVRR